jgi:L-threonylcarbamoyladenylate synthase
MILELADQRISKNVTGNMDRIGVRIPNNRCALSLIEKSGGVLVGTSANRSGEPSATSAEDVLNRLEGFDAILDGGKSVLGIESTVVDVISGVRVIRQGYVKYEEIERVLHDV